MAQVANCAEKGREGRKVLDWRPHTGNRTCVYTLNVDQGTGEDCEKSLDASDKNFCITRRKEKTLSKVYVCNSFALLTRRFTIR